MQYISKTGSASPTKKTIGGFFSAEKVSHSSRFGLLHSA